MVNRRLPWIAAIATGLLLVFTAGLSAVTPAAAAVIDFKVDVNGASEVPPLARFGGGAVVYFSFNDATNQLSYQFDVSGIDPLLVVAGHIHRGAAGVNGPIVYTLLEAGKTHSAGTINLTAADVADLRAGNFYANVHSSVFPAGFGRGQLVLPSVAAPRAGDGGLLGAGGALPPAGFLLVLGGVAAFVGLAGLSAAARGRA